MLRQRIITGVILALGLISAVLFLSVPALAVALGAVVAIAAWEWSALADLRAVWSRGLYVLLCLGGMLLLYAHCQLGSDPLLIHVQPILGLACPW